MDRFQKTYPRKAGSLRVNQNMWAHSVFEVQGRTEHVDKFGV
jgi:hypothetical protein